MPRLRTLASLLLVAVIALPGLTLAATPASAADDHQITRWEQTFALQADGSAQVRLEIDLDFGNTPGRGPYMVLPIRQGYNDTHDRRYPVTDVQASSPTGAPANVYLSDNGSWLEVRVGDRNIDTVSGVQTYVITWTVAGVMNSTPASAGVPAGDEFYWNAIGDGWAFPISDATVTVLAPADVVLYQCFSAAFGIADPCDTATATGSEARFTQARLEPGQPFTVDVLYPAGVFDTEPLLVESGGGGGAEDWSELSPGFMAYIGVLLLLGLAIFVVGLVLIIRRLATTAVDRQYAGVIPGLTPPAGFSPAGMPAEEPATVRRDKKAPIAVQFQPPKGMRPGQIGTLIDEKADTRDVTATIVDLAVRGYIRIDYMGKTGSFLSKADEYRLVQLAALDADALPYEHALYNGLFAGRHTVLMSDLSTTFLSTMTKVQDAMYQDVTERGWFFSNPKKARNTWMMWGALLTIGGVFGTLLLTAAFGLGLLFAPLVPLGLIMLFSVGAVPARTADGTAVLVQAQGFEHYLRTAEADQIRFEEGEDVFSKYLPYAIAFGVAERWAKVFADLAARGVQTPEPTWFAGLAAGSFFSQSSDFGARIANFATVASSAMAAPTPGSSGGSGFSSGGGGGGFSGGGGGGGGGGSW